MFLQLVSSAALSWLWYRKYVLRCLRCTKKLFLSVASIPNLIYYFVWIPASKNPDNVVRSISRWFCWRFLFASSSSHNVWLNTLRCATQIAATYTNLLIYTIKYSKQVHFPFPYLWRSSCRRATLWIRFCRRDMAPPHLNTPECFNYYWILLQ